eukprot:4603363-Pleurochrysis_carterae.AAC.3
MAGSTVDDYVLGKTRSAKSKSPSLAINTVVLCDLVYSRMAKSNTAPTPTPDASSAPRADASFVPATRQPYHSRRRRIAPSTGFNAGGEAETEVVGLSEDDLIDLDDLDTMETADCPEIQTTLKQKYGNHAQNVADVLLLWEAFAEMFSAWRDDWADRTPEYRAQRALRFLRAGMCPPLCYPLHHIMLCLLSLCCLHACASSWHLHAYLPCSQALASLLDSTRCPRIGTSHGTSTWLCSLSLSSYMTSATLGAFQPVPLSPVVHVSNVLAGVPVCLSCALRIRGGDG